MKTLRAERKELDLSLYKKRQAQEEDYTLLIAENCVIIEKEKPIIVYLELEDSCEGVVDACQRIEYRQDYRTGGMMGNSRTFGFQPRVTIRKDYCSASKLASEMPYEHALISGYAQKVATYYQQYNAELYEKHQQLVEKVLPVWKLEESVFTSGIINKNNPLPYHFDAGNFKGVWSNMLVFKRDIRGGYLSVPEYNVGFELKHNSLLMFDGQNILHGVTPIYRKNEQAFRYSIVYYSLQQMWKCLLPGEELGRIRELRSEREERRLMKHLEKEHAE